MKKCVRHCSRRKRWIARVEAWASGSWMARWGWRFGSNRHSVGTKRNIPPKAENIQTPKDWVTSGAWNFVSHPLVKLVGHPPKSSYKTAQPVASWPLLRLYPTITSYFVKCECLNASFFCTENVLWMDALDLGGLDGDFWMDGYIA